VGAEGWDCHARSSVIGTIEELCHVLLIFVLQYRANSKKDSMLKRFLVLGCVLTKVGIKESQDNQIFESRVSHVEFTKDGKRIYVLTRDQMLYGFNLDPVLSK
jgi:hypothetical protein